MIRPSRVRFCLEYWPPRRAREAGLAILAPGATWTAPVQAPGGVCHREKAAPASLNRRAPWGEESSSHERALPFGEARRHAQFGVNDARHVGLIAKAELHRHRGEVNLPLLYELDSRGHAERVAKLRQRYARDGSKDPADVELRGEARRREFDRGAVRAR